MGGAPAHPLWARIRHVPFVRVEDETDVQLEKMATAGWEFIYIRSRGYDGTAWVQCQTCGMDVRASQFVVHCVIRNGARSNTSECAIRASQRGVSWPSTLAAASLDRDGEKQKQSDGAQEQKNEQKKRSRSGLETEGQPMTRRPRPGIVWNRDDGSNWMGQQIAVELAVDVSKGSRQVVSFVPWDKF